LNENGEKNNIIKKNEAEEKPDLDLVVVCSVYSSLHFPLFMKSGKRKITRIIYNLKAVK